MTILIEINDDDNDYANWLIIIKMMLTILMMMTIDNLSIDGNDNWWFLSIDDDDN